MSSSLPSCFHTQCFHTDNAMLLQSTISFLFCYITDQENGLRQNTSTIAVSAVVAVDLVLESCSELVKSASKALLLHASAAPLWALLEHMERNTINCTCIVLVVVAKTNGWRKVGSALDSCTCWRTMILHNESYCLWELLQLYWNVRYLAKQLIIVFLKICHCKWYL